MKAPLLLAILALTGCGPNDGRVPNDVHILPDSAIHDMLGQCSRDAPRIGQGSWPPLASQIAALETQLPGLLKSRQPGQDWSGFPQGWYRQYVGIVRDGRRYLYGNFVPRRDDDPPEFRKSVDSFSLGACDGGPHFFGVELDVQSGRITHLAFNGSIASP